MTAERRRGIVDKVFSYLDRHNRSKSRPRGTVGGYTTEYPVSIKKLGPPLADWIPPRKAER